MHPKHIEKRVLQPMGRAVYDFDLLDEGDRVLVAMSGGKDSYALLWGLKRLLKASPVKFELVGYHLDQGQPGHDPSPLEDHLRAEGLEYEIEYQDTYTTVVEKTEPGKIYCSLCSRLRRAILYGAARRHGCNKVALGHHRDDLAETLLLNIFYSGQLKSMPPKLQSDSGGEQIIRPLCYVAEEDIVQLRDMLAFPIMPCQLCGSLDSKRKAIKKLLTTLSADNPHVKGNIIAALKNVTPSHLLDAKFNDLFPEPSPSTTPLPIHPSSIGIH